MPQFRKLPVHRPRGLYHHRYITDPARSFCALRDTVFPLPSGRAYQFPSRGEISQPTYIEDDRHNGVSLSLLCGRTFPPEFPYITSAQRRQAWSRDTTTFPHQIIWRPIDFSGRCADKLMTCYAAKRHSRRNRVMAKKDRPKESKGKKSKKKAGKAAKKAEKAARTKPGANSASMTK